MPEQLRVGVIGAGNMGRYHIRNYSEMEEVDLVAIADPTSEAKELAEQYQASHYESHLDMLDDARPSAVSIAVPTYLHYEVARDVITRGIHTLIEKPIAKTEMEAHELVDLSRVNEVVLMVGHVERYNPVVRELKRIIDSGQVGEISSIIAQRLGGFPKNEPETDVAIDLAIHDIDIISYLTGCQPEILAIHGTNTFHRTETDSAEILLRYGNASGFIQANWVSPVKIRQISITGSRGYVTANYITQEISVFEHMAIRDQDNFDDFVRQLGNPEGKNIKFTKTEEPLRKELGAFVLAASGRRSEILVTPEDAIIALKTAIQITKKLKENENSAGIAKS